MVPKCIMSFALGWGRIKAGISLHAAAAGLWSLFPTCKTGCWRLRAVGWGGWLRQALPRAGYEVVIRLHGNIMRATIWAEGEHFAQPQRHDWQGASPEQLGLLWVDLQKFGTLCRDRL